MSALFQRSLTGGLLIAVILLLRKLLQDRLPKGTFRALWIIALFHLLLPKLPTSPLSLYNLSVRKHLLVLKVGFARIKNDKRRKVNYLL